MDRVFGMQEQALLIRSKRAEILANNLANADTPGFKARDIDFKAMMAQLAGPAQGQFGLQRIALRGTDPRHFSSMSGVVANTEVLYRQPMQPSLDGNTVDSQREHSAFAENAMGYMTTLRFMTGRIQGLMKAIRGQ
ncbi:MAG TPA: flagellar basal body rod protein FlgB [Gammaproteobacteria bacterium]|nr:flagellar basal body rod protein FlgB [Gammaproteobacteria bacterium]